MKKWLAFLRTLIVIFSLLSVILIVFSTKITNMVNKSKAGENSSNITEEKEIELKAGTTIRVKMTNTNEIIAMDMNDYLRGVVPAEMPPSYNMEALKAQAVVARTYTYKKIDAMPKNSEYDITDSYQIDQAFYTKEKLFSIWQNKGYDENTINDYWNRVTEAVMSTSNMVITYNGEYIKAFFHASSPEKTENVDQIWGGENLPYLVSVESIEDENYTWNTSKVELTYDEFEKKVTENINSIYSIENRSSEDIISIESYTTSGRVKTVKIGDDSVSAEKLRTIFSLRSTNFKLEVNNEKIVFNVIGNGHGVGMSQVGANYYASEGKNYIEIIKHYYTGVDVVKVN